MKFPRFTVAAALLVTVLCRAQTPPLASATMQQTIASINSSFTRQGEVANPDGGYTIDHQRVSLDGSCILSYYHSFQAGDSEPRNLLVHVRLDKSDAGSVGWVKLANSGTTIFNVSSNQPTSATDAAAHFEATPQLGSFTTPQAANSVADAYRHAIASCHNTTANVQSAPIPPPLPPQPPPAPSSGPTIEETIAFINNASADQGPVKIHMVGKDCCSSAVFKQASVPQDPCGVEITHGEFRYKVELSAVDPRSVRILGWVAYNHEKGLDFTVIDPEVYVVTLRDKREKYAPELGDFQDKAMAERVAKAWIHAAVICHKDEAPSPF